MWVCRVHMAQVATRIRTRTYLINGFQLGGWKPRTFSPGSGFFRTREIAASTRPGFSPGNPKVWIS
jgi:hypothetical protein